MFVWLPEEDAYRCSAGQKLRRTRFSGRWRVQIQVWLAAAAMNISGP